jgi:hypothetical protein
MFVLKQALAASMIRRSLNEKDLPLSELERKHSGEGEPLFNESAYFLGRGADGSYMVVRMAFRTGREPEYWLAFRIPGKGTFELKDMETAEGDGFRLGDLEFSCTEPGKKWKIRYSGIMHRHTQVHFVLLDLDFEATGPLVNFKNISRPSDLAPVIAREKWTLKFFRRLKEIRKVHLEQGGRITGTLEIDGAGITVDWVSVRDHSWGTRCWMNWKRHVWLSGVLDSGETFNLSMIAYDFLGQLSAGYLTQGNMLLYFEALPDMESFAAGAPAPAAAGFDFLSRDGQPHRLEMRMPGSFDFLMDGIYHIREGMGDFVLDGVPGKGVAEFGYNTGYYDHST